MTAFPLKMFCITLSLILIPALGETIELFAEGKMSHDQSDYNQCQQQAIQAQTSLDDCRVENDSLRVARTEMDGLNLQLSSDIRDLKQKVTELNRLRENCLDTSRQLQLEKQETAESLKASADAISSLRAEKDKVEKEGNERARRLRTSLIDAASKQSSVEASARECKADLVAVAEREVAFQREAHKIVEELRMQVANLLKYQEEASRCEKMLEKSESNVQHQKRLVMQANWKCDKQLDEEKEKYDEMSNNLFLSRRELVAARNRMRELHSQAESTHVNVTLIQESLVRGGRRTLLSMARMLDDSVAAMQPHANAFFAAFEPLTISLTSLMDGPIASVIFLNPVANVVSVWHGYLTKLLSGFARFACDYLELTQSHDAAIRHWLTRQLHSIGDNSGTLVTMLLVLVGVALSWILLSLRRIYGTEHRHYKEMGIGIEPFPSSLKQSQ